MAIDLTRYADKLERLFESANHGTRLEDVETAFSAGFSAAARLRGIKDRPRMKLTEALFSHYREKTNVRKLAKMMAGYSGYAKVRLRSYKGRRAP